MEDFEEALRQFRQAVDVPDPALDQAFAAVREVIRTVGLGELNARDARIALTMITLYLSTPEESRPAVSAYLGSLTVEPEGA